MRNGRDDFSIVFLLAAVGVISCLAVGTATHVDHGLFAEFWKWLSEHGVEIVAIAASPIIALQISARLERSRDAENSKLDVLKTLMATRHSQFADDRIRALNSIDVLFRNDSDVREARKQLMISLSKTEGLNADGVTITKDLSDEWNDRQWRLISAMAAVLDVPLTQSDFSAGYSPKAMNETAQQQHLTAEYHRSMIMFARKELGLHWNPKALINMESTPWAVVGKIRQNDRTSTNGNARPGVG